MLWNRYVSCPVQFQFGIPDQYRRLGRANRSSSSFKQAEWRGGRGRMQRSFSKIRTCESSKSPCFLHKCNCSLSETNSVRQRSIWEMCRSINKFVRQGFNFGSVDTSRWKITKWNYKWTRDLRLNFAKDTPVNFELSIYFVWLANLLKVKLPMLSLYRSRSHYLLYSVENGSISDNEKNIALMNLDEFIQFNLIACDRHYDPF